MPWLIGTDEAGYGPNLGPLVISATCWEVGDGSTAEELYRLLGEVIAAEADGSERLLLADSKVVFGRGGLAALELGVLSTLEAAGFTPRSFRDLWEHLAPGVLASVAHEPWFAEFEPALPIEAPSDEILRHALRLTEAMKSSGVALRRIVANPVFPARYNALVDRLGNKATAPSEQTLELVAGMLPMLRGNVSVHCDKHGGRNAYGGLLQHRFPEQFVEHRGEGREISRYHMAMHGGRWVDFSFAARGESALPIALASMVSKYLRELAMLAFNRFWCARVPNLRPTAGYPVDARRFKLAISSLQSQLGVDDRVIWRAR